MRAEALLRPVEEVVDDRLVRRLETARRLYTERRRREGAFEDMAPVFRDPAWDMALDLYVAGCERRPVSASSASIASRTPMTTGLRCLERMVRTGVVYRTGDPSDARRSLVSLTREARDRMGAYLDSVR